MDKPASTAEKPKKRNTYVEYNLQPQKGLNIDNLHNQQGMTPQGEASSAENYEVLIEIIREKTHELNDCNLTIDHQAQLIKILVDDIEYLKGELANPNLFLKK